MTEALRDPVAVSDFCETLTAGLDRSAVVGAAHTLVRRGDGVERRYGSFSSCRPGVLWDEVERLAWSVGVRQAEAWQHAWRLGYPDVLTGLAQHWTEAETVVRTVAFAEAPLDDDGRPRGGRADEVAAVMAIALDLDVAEHRHDGKPYCPTTTHGLGFWSELSPSAVINVGRGLNALWLFRAPCSDIEAARLLGLDLREHVKVLADDRGWDFDSPNPLGAWVRVPGTWSWRSQHLASIVAEGDRWVFDDLRQVVPVAEHHTTSWAYRPDMTAPPLRQDRPGVLSRPVPPLITPPRPRERRPSP